jgi:hypothetical protein
MFGCREHHYDLRSPAYYEGALSARPINPAGYEPHLAAAEIRHARPRLHSDRRSNPESSKRRHKLFSIFHGTHDILFADTRKLIARLDQEGIAVDFFEFPHMGAVPDVGSAGRSRERKVSTLPRRRDSGMHQCLHAHVAWPTIVRVVPLTRFCERGSRGASHGDDLEWRVTAEGRQDHSIQ